MNNLLITASSYAHAGLSVIPTMADKRPACAWKPFTERVMSDREIETFFGGRPGTSAPTGIGIVCGKVSGNLELLDFDDGGSAFEPWFTSIPEYLAKRLVVETSPSGGKHVFYRVDQGQDGGTTYAVPGNRKLAMKADGHVLIETRGEGGYVKCSPSQGYELMTGDFLHVPTVSPFEQQIMIDAAVALDERGEEKKVGGDSRSTVEGQPSAFREFTSGITPWEDYNQRGDFAALLEKHGWKRTKGGDNEHWERPGKDERSTSATWNGTVFYVFSSNVWGFEPNKGYNKFQAFARMECGGDIKEAARRLRNLGYGGPGVSALPEYNENGDLHCSPSPHTFTSGDDQSPVDPGAIPEELLHVPGFVDLLVEHTLACAPYPNRTLAFAGALTMLAHLSGRNFRDPRNLRTNCLILACAESGVGKDFPRKVNMNLATELGIMGGMADRFASAEGLEDALLVRPCSFFQVDEIDTLFASLAVRGDSAMEKIYGALLQFATSSDTTFAMRKKAIQQTGGKAGKFDKIRARGIREPHLTLLGTAIPKYLFSAISERAMENGLLSRCLVIEAGARGKAGTPHFEPFKEELLRMARHFVSLGGFDGLDLENLDDSPVPYVEPYTVSETEGAIAAHNRVTEMCESLYSASKTTSEKALWTRGAEKASRLALLYALSENPFDPLITDAAVEWAWRVVEHLTKRLLFQASVYVHDNEFDALRQKAIRLLRDYGGSMNHGMLLRYMHVDADTLRKVVETLVQSELVVATQLVKGGVKYALI